MDIREVRTRNMLIEAFEELNKRKAFDEITVSELCEQSTVRRGTFYRHFEDKYAFYEYYLSTLTERFLAEVGDAGDDLDLRSYTTMMHRRLIAFIGNHPGLAKRDFGRGAYASTLDLMMKEIAVGIVRHIDKEAAERGLDLKIPSEFLGMLYAGGMVHTLRWWLLNDQPLSADDLERFTTDFFMKYFE